MTPTDSRRLLLEAFLKHLHDTGALAVPPEDLTDAVNRFAREEHS